jgi:hypothetical protein
MHTLMVIGCGLVTLVVFVLIGRRLGGGSAAAAAKGAAWFIPAWLAAAAANLWIGVSRAGYTVDEELPIFLIVFGVPAAIAALTWWRFSRTRPA